MNRRRTAGNCAAIRCLTASRVLPVCNGCGPICAAIRCLIASRVRNSGGGAGCGVGTGGGGLGDGGRTGAGGAAAPFGGSDFVFSRPKTASTMSTNLASFTGSSNFSSSIAFLLNLSVIVGALTSVAASEWQPVVAIHRHPSEQTRQRARAIGAVD